MVRIVDGVCVGHMTGMVSCICSVVLLRSIVIERWCIVDLFVEQTCDVVFRMHRSY